MTIPKGTRAVLVTGGSRGLGLAIVRTLLAEGYRVGTCSRTLTGPLQQLIEEQKPADRLYWRTCEIGDEQSESSFFHGFLEWSRKEDFYGLVNNAGVAKEGILATFPNLESARIINVNLMASLRMARLALQVLLTRPGAGRIINISSIIAARGYTGLAAYSASKAGLDGLTRALAREVGRRQITVNSVNPGYLLTDMSASLEQEQRSQIIRRTPLGRLGTVEDVCPVVRFLLGDEAAFITGQSILVDGGISC
ncbi:MAG: SDR family oxidoreductase [Candidatus Korobacteraceae bacterium]